jgi:hypothetical protein
MVIPGANILAVCLPLHNVKWMAETALGVKIRVFNETLFNRSSFTASDSTTIDAVSLMSAAKGLRQTSLRLAPVRCSESAFDAWLQANPSPASHARHIQQVSSMH